MDFISIAQTRQSCRNFDPARPLPQQALDAVLQAAQLAPSACNGQPWHITVCSGSSAARVASACTGMGMNRFAACYTVVKSIFIIICNLIIRISNF